MLRHLLYSPEGLRLLSMQMMTFARRGGLQPVAVTRQTPMRSSRAPEGVSHQKVNLSWQLPVPQHTDMHGRHSSYVGTGYGKQACGAPIPHGLCCHCAPHELQRSLDTSGAGAGKRQRVSPQDDAFHFFNRDNIDRDPPRKPYLEEAAMALLLLDVHSAPAKVGDPGTSSCLLCFCPLPAPFLQRAEAEHRWYS